MKVDEVVVDLVLDKSRFGPGLTDAQGGLKGLQGILSGLPGPLGAAASGVGQLGAGFAGLAGSTVVLAGVAAGVAAIGAAAFKVGMDWEAAEATIRTGTGATGEALADLKESAKDVFSGVPESAGVAAQAVADLNTRTGQTGQGLEDLATQTINLARITGTDLGAAIAATTRVFGDWSIASDQQAAANDFLFKTSQATGIGLDRLANSVVQYGAPMRQLGFSFEETAVLMGKFEKEGVNLETVMSGMRIGLANLAKAGLEPAEGLRSTMEAIQGAGDSAAANTIAIEVFGQRSGPDMAAAIREGRFEIDEMVAALSASGETINQAANDALTLGDKFDLLTGKVGLLLEPLGTGMVDAASAGLDGLIAFGSGIGDVATGLVLLTDELLATIPGWDSVVAAATAVYDFLAGGLLLIIDKVGVAFGWLAEKAGAAWDFLKAKGEASTKDLDTAQKDAATSAKDLAGAIEGAGQKAATAERPTTALAGAHESLKGKAKDAEKALRDAEKAYADLEPKARAAAMGVELFTLRAGESPVKVDGLAEAARRAAADIKAAHDSGELVAPTIDQAGASALAAAPLISELAFKFNNLDVAAGLAKDSTLAWLNQQNDANYAALEAAGAFQAIGFEAGELARPGNPKGLPAVSTAITDLSGAIMETITGEGSFFSKAKNILVDFGTTIGRQVIEMALTPLINSFTKLLGFNDGLKGLGDTLGGLFGNIFGGGGGGGGGGLGGLLGGGGGGGLGGLLSGGLSMSGPIGMAMTFAGSFLGNLLGGPDMDTTNLHTLETTNELRNLRRDQWQQHTEVLSKWDTGIPTWWDNKDAVQKIAAELTGGIIVSGYSGPAQQQAAQAAQAGTEAAAPTTGAETGAAVAQAFDGTPPQRSRTAAAADSGAALVMLPGDTSGLNGRAPGRSRTGTMQADPVYQDSLSLMERNPLAVAAAQAGNVLASLVTGGLFFTPSEPQPVEDPATASAIEELTAAVAEGNEGTQAVRDAEAAAKMDGLLSRVDALLGQIAALAGRPMQILLNGREIAYAVGEELDAMQLAQGA